MKISLFKRSVRDRKKYVKSPEGNVSPCDYCDVASLKNTVTVNSPQNTSTSAGTKFSYSSGLTKPAFLYTL